MRDRKSGARGPGLRRRNGGASSRGTPGTFSGTEPALAARNALTTALARSDPLFNAIPTRHTNRGPYRDQPIAPERLQALADLVSGPSLRVVFGAEAGVRHDLGVIIVAATERIIADPEMSSDNHRWLRTGRRDIWRIGTE